MRSSGECKRSKIRSSNFLYHIFIYQHIIKSFLRTLQEINLPLKSWAILVHHQLLLRSMLFLIHCRFSIFFADIQFSSQSNRTQSHLHHLTLNDPLRTTKSFERMKTFSCLLHRLLIFKTFSCQTHFLVGLGSVAIFTSFSCYPTKLFIIWSKRSRLLSYLKCAFYLFPLEISFQTSFTIGDYIKQDEMKIAVVDGAGKYLNVVFKKKGNKIKQKEKNIKKSKKKSCNLSNFSLRWKRQKLKFHDTFSRFFNSKSTLRMS